MTGRDEGACPVLDIDGLKKHFGRANGVLDRLLGGNERIRAVDGVDLTVHEGEVMAVVGESGCGKSTLAETIVGLHSPTDGRIRYRGKEITGLSDRQMRPYRTDIQMVFQNPLGSLNPRRTIGEILTAPLKVHGIGDGSDDREQRAREALVTVGLDPDSLRRYPHQFSGGQQQRIAIARSLTVEPDLLIADEPVSSLDVSVQAQILGLLERLRSERGIAIVFIAHDLSVVKHVADRVAVMYLGEIVETAPTAALFDSPAHPYTKSLLSAVPRVGSAGRGVEDRVILRGTPPSPSSPPSGCRFHTRCPVIVPPEDWSGTPDQFLDAFHFRASLVAGGVDADAIERRIRAEGATPSPELVVDYVLDEHFETPLEEFPRQAAETIREAAETYVREGTRSAADLLADAFPTPCETTVPDETAVDDEHAASCHRVDPNQPGGTGELEY
jgi:peptide/nickel transport system ATP-binding protein